MKDFEYVKVTVKHRPLNSMDVDTTFFGFDLLVLLYFSSWSRKKFPRIRKNSQEFFKFAVYVFSNIAPRLNALILFKCSCGIIIVVVFSPKLAQWILFWVDYFFLELILWHIGRKRLRKILTGLGNVILVDIAFTVTGFQSTGLRRWRVNPKRS